MTLEASVLRPDALHATPAGYELEVHLPWYRSLPLSCLEEISLTIDGRRVAVEDLRVERDGQDYAVADLADLVDEQWFVQDGLRVRVPDDAPSAIGDSVALEVELATRIPYIIIGPGAALVQRTRVERKVVVR